MTTLILRRIVRLAVAGMLSLFLSIANAQQTAPEQPTLGSFPPPKDARTRAKAHAELGSLYFQSGNLIVALEELTLAAAIDPEYATAFSTRGLILYYVKEFDSAEKDFQRALSLEGKNPEINNNYGWFLCQTGKVKESIEYFERAYKNPLYQTPTNAYTNAGACYLKLGELDLAEDALRKSIRLAPENPETLYHLADVAYRRGNFDAARKHLTDAGRISDPGPEMLWLSYRVERRLGNEIEAQSLASQLRRRYPDTPEYQALLKGNSE